MKVETTIAIEADLLEQVKNAAKDFRIIWILKKN